MKTKRAFEVTTSDCKEFVFSIASDIPYERTNDKFGTYDEVLKIDQYSIDWDRIRSGAMAFLLEHDTDKQIGVITDSFIDGNKLKVKVKFSNSDKVQDIVSDIENGIRTNTSVGYDIKKYHFEVIDGKKTMIADRWMPYEASLVSIPADPNVGLNRSKELTMEEDSNKEELEQQKACGDCEVENNEQKACGEKKEMTEEKPAITPEIQAIIDEAVKCALAKAMTPVETEETVVEAPVQAEIVEEIVDAKEDAYEDAAEIAALGKIEGAEALAEEFINNKKSLKEFKEELNNNTITSKEQKNMEKFSLRKALLNEMGEISDENASLERSIIDENKRKYNSDAQIVVNKENLRAFPDGSEALNQAQYRPDLYTQNLRPQNVIAKTGARVINVDGPDITFGVCTSGLNAGFVDLNNEIPSASMDWELKTMTPKKLGAYVQISKKALLQDRPDVENIILDDIDRALNQCKDEAAICGDGTSNKPTGIYNTSGINTVTLPSGDWTLSTALAFEKPIRDSNDFSDNLKWVMNSNMYYKLAATPKSAKEQNAFLIDDDRKMIGYDTIICNALPASGIILGNFDELLVAEFNAMEINVVSDAGLSRKQAKEVQAFEAVDVLVRRKKSFTKGN